MEASRNCANHTLRESSVKQIRAFSCRFSLTGYKASKFEAREYQRKFMIPNALFAVLFCNVISCRQCSSVSNGSWCAAVSQRLRRRPM